MNPIIRRELVGLLRTRNAVAVQVALAVAVAVLILVRWPAAGVGDLTGATALQVLRVFGYGLLTGILLIVPAFPATAIVRERVRGTLPLLLNSPLSVVSIYAGKLLGVLGFTGLLLVITLPGAAACDALGGSTSRDGVGMLYIVLAVTTIQIATLGLLVSSRSQGIDSALRTTYALVLGVCILPLVAHFLIPREDPDTAVVAEWLGSLSPVPAVMESVGQGDAGIPGTDYKAGAVTRYLIVALGMSVLCALLTISRLHGNPLDRARPPGVMTQDLTLGGRLARRAMFLVDPRKRSGSTSLWVNPVMVKEFRTRRFGRSDWTLRLLAISAILSLGLSVVAVIGALGWGIEVVGGALVILQAIILILFVPSLSAGLISAERENGGWQLLRLTPLSPGRIIRGKLLSAAWPVLLLLGATLPGYVVLTTVKPELSHQIARVLICLGLTAVFAVLVGAAASSVFRTTAAATAASYLILVFVCVGPLLVWLGRDAPFGHKTVEAALTIDPLAAALKATDMPGFTAYDLLPYNWWLIGSACVALLLVLIIRTRQLYRPE
jgi:ABC-type transport system involved in multi-copper enzyme maturation permease subunit